MPPSEPRIIPSCEDWFSAINAVEDIVMILDLDKKIVGANIAVLKATGLSENQLIGRYCYEIFHGKSLPPFDCPHSRLQQSLVPESNTMQMEMLGGVYMVTAAPVFNDHGEMIRTAYTARNISHQEKAKKQLQRVNRALNTLNESNKILSRPFNELELLHQLCRVIVDLGGYHMAWIGFALDDAQKTVCPVAYWGFHDNYLDSAKITWSNTERGKGPTGTAIRTGKPFICRNILTDPLFAPWRDEATKRGYASSASFPLFVNESVVGTLNLYAVERDAFDDKEMGLLLGLASDISYGIATRRSHEERKKTESELEKRAAEWANAMDFIEDAVYLIGLDDKVIQANRTFYKMTGFTPEMTIGKDIRTLMHPHGEPEPCPVCRARKERKDAQLFMDADHPDNPMRRPIQTMIKIIRNERGEPVSVLMGVRDLSPVEELKKQAQIIDQLQEAVITTDLKGAVLTWNGGAVTLLGYEEKEALGRNISEIILCPPADKGKCDYVSLARKLLCSPASTEVRIAGKSGNSFFALIRSSPLVGQSGEKIGTILSLKDISARKTAELKLIESQERYRQLVENTSDWIWEIDSDGRFTYSSSKVKELLGYDPGEVLDKRTFDLMPKEEAERVSPKFSTIVEARQPFIGFESTYLHKDGRQIILETNGVPIFDDGDEFQGYRGIDRDITLRKENERNQANQAIMWALGADIGQAVSTAGNLHDMVQMCCEAIFSRLHAAVARIWILQPPGNMLVLHGSAGMSTHLDLDDPHGRIAMDSGYKIAQIGGRKKPHLTNQVIGNPQIADQDWAKREKIVSFAGYPLTIGDRLIGVMALFSRHPLSDFVLKTFESVADKIAIDIDRKIAGREKEELQKQVRQMQKMEAIGTLAGGIAHDFNNILTAILGFGDLLKYELHDNSNAQECLEQILLAGKRARDLVKQILAFSRQTEHERQPLHAHLVIKEAVKLLRASIPSPITINENIDSQCGTIMADPTEIHQIVMNLCTNAYHAMQHHGGTLKIELRKMEVAKEITKFSPGMEEGKYVRLRVTDTGQGMDSATLERIFEPYFTTKKIGEGTGMGLALVHGIVQSLHGGIDVKSAPGRGCTFDVYFPAIESEMSAETSAAMTNFPGGTERVLFVDDEEAVAVFNEIFLKKLGYQVTMTTSSSEALRLFRKNPENFDLVITDQMMPHLTGTELAQKITALRPDIPIILLTGFSHMLTPEQAARMGIRQYAMKPLLIDHMAQIIRKALEKK
ncbi:MAG: PAS domain S-box protein [Pseudomonadota bacterium]